MIEIFKELECKLLSQDVRSNPEKIKQLVHENFIEFGASGKTYYLDDLLNIASDESFSFQMFEFKVSLLSPYCALVLYSIEISTLKGDMIKSNRSSIWKYENNSWKIIFHQGTKISE